LAENRRTRFITIIVIILLICFFLYWPTLRWLVNSWLSSNYYSHGFLVPFVSAFFVWIKRKQLRLEKSIPVAIPVFILGLALYISSMVWDIRFFGALSLLAILTASVFYFFGRHGARTLIFPLCFLLFMIPFPFVSDLTVKLQQIAITGSSHLLAFFGLPITTSGAEIYLGQSPFTIGIACSGIDTFVALLALATIYAYILYGNFYKRAGLFVLAIPIAIISNTLRIVSIILVAYYVNITTATTWYHDIASPIFFFIAFGILLIIGWLMRLKIDYASLGMK
jgi:exosortase